MIDTIKNYAGQLVKVSGSSELVDDIGGLAGDEKELANLVGSLGKTWHSYRIKTNADKTNCYNEVRSNIKMEGKKTETINLGTTISDEGTKPEILAKIAWSTTTLTTYMARQSFSQVSKI